MDEQRYDFSHEAGDATLSAVIDDASQYSLQIWNDEIGPVLSVFYLTPAQALQLADHLAQWARGSE